MVGNYLTETATLGNVIKGFDGFLKGQYVRHGRSANTNVDVERIFSGSSGSFLKAMDSEDERKRKWNKKRRVDESDSDDTPKRVRISLKDSAAD